MAKVCSKRKSAIQKRKLDLAKRHWLLHRPGKAAKKSQHKRKLNRNTEQRQVVSSHGRFVVLNKVNQTIEFLTRAVGKLCCVELLLNYTSNLPVKLFNTATTLYYTGFDKSLLATKQGKERVQKTLAISMYNGYSQFKKVVNFVGDIIFPSRPYKRKLDEMCDRLEEVENELKKLKSDAMLNNQALMINPSSVINTVVPSVPSLPPAPPPPPPPPPPICKLPEAITFKKKKVDKQNTAKACKVGVTLEDLKSVKLKKVVEVEAEDKENLLSPLKFGLKKRTTGKFPVSPTRSSNHHPFITLKDIKKVTLRKTEPKSTKKSRSPGHCQVAFLKTNLRKVHTRRSPGGTPFTDKSKQCYGEGLTPIMTRALQKKFKLANPPSPVDSFNDTNTFIDKTLTDSSPQAPVTSPRPQSLLTRSLVQTPLTRSKAQSLGRCSSHSKLVRCSSGSSLTPGQQSSQGYTSPVARSSQRSPLTRIL